MPIFFQSPSTPDMIQIILLHDLILVLLVPIILIATLIFTTSIFLFSEKNSLITRYEVEDYRKILAFRVAIIRFLQFNHSSILELIWTIIPILILGIMCANSLPLIFTTNFELNPVLSLKIFGNQWYWTYNYIVDLNFLQELLREEDAIILEELSKESTSKS